jgi:hypothetical protein
VTKSLVEDGRTDPNQRNYEGLWAHGMLDGRRVSFCIGQIPVERADSATLAPVIAARLLELGLTKENDHEISFIVGDSASINPKIVSTFNRETGNESSFIPCSCTEQYDAGDMGEPPRSYSTVAARY